MHTSDKAGCLIVGVFGGCLAVILILYFIIDMRV
jgi:hypothetical protein